MEQDAFALNLPRIRKMLQSHQAELTRRGFWTELSAEERGLRYRYSRVGFYGPGGFSSQYHVAGPLILGRIDPRGDPVASFYANDLEQNVFIGERFDEIAFGAFLHESLVSYLAPENLIVSPQQYRWIKELLAEHAS